MNFVANNLIELYTSRKNAFGDQAEKVQQKERLTSWVRVGLMVSIFVLGYFSFQFLPLWGAVLLFSIGYVYAVKQHEELKREVSLLRSLSEVNAWEIEAQKGNHSNFSDGIEFIDSHHPFSFDLDIFGEGSLFQRINRTSTEPGKERLASILACPLSSTKQIIERQQAGKELSAKLDFRQHFQAIGLSSLEKKKDQQEILDWLTLPSFVFGKSKYKVMLIVFPLLSLITLLFWLITGSATPFVISGLIQMGIMGSHAKRITLLQNYIGSKRYLLEKFAQHFDLLSKEKFESTLTIELNRESHEAKNELLSLASRSRALDLRLNLFATLLLNSTVLYDILCVYRLEQWREKNREHLGKWLKAIAEADALNSLASFAFNHPKFVTPEISEDFELVAEDFGHPLIADENRVCSNVQMDGNSNIWIVTGANMAGKSTFLRTVGINVVLALTGSVVCASKMKCPVIEICSGMRNTDSINENQSYFFAELLRLQGIIEKLNKGSRLVILLDEILKGTNSIDKLSGSQELVKQLTSFKCLAIIATHDVALGEMENMYSTIKNFHFETFITGDSLHFDYKLKPGVSTGKNATFLMRKMGIIPSV